MTFTLFDRSTERQVTNTRWLAPELFEELRQWEDACRKDKISSGRRSGDATDRDFCDQSSEDGTRPSAEEPYTRKRPRMLSKPGDIYAFGCVVLEVSFVACLQVHVPDYHTLDHAQPGAFR